MADANQKIETSADLDRGRGGGLFWEITKTILIFLGSILIFRFYIFQPFLVKGISMEPNFHEDQYLVVNEFSYHFGNPKRGDPIVFKHPEPACNDFIKSGYINRVFLQGPCINYIKRVVGLPGETVTIKDGKVFIKNEKNPDGFELKESYIVPGLATLGNQVRVLGKNEYFVLGDNREPNASSDSREWGVLPKAHIIGRASMVLLPFNQATIIKNPTY